MPRPSRLDAQRTDLLPVLAQAFGELGFRRATTAELARRCGVRENILYRHWPDKVTMFVAALDHVHDLAVATWSRVLATDGAPEHAAERLVDYEAEHLGEFGNYRIIFAALGDTDTPEIARALRRMYRSFFRVIRDALATARGSAERDPPVDDAAWAVIGLGTIATIVGELGILNGRQRAALLAGVGRSLIAGRARP